MVDVLRNETPVARKEHRCQFCGGKILKGEKYSHYVCVSDGSIGEEKMHLGCAEVLREYFEENPYEDYWMVNAVMEGINEKLKDNGITPAEYVEDAVKQYIEWKRKKQQ